MNTMPCQTCGEVIDLTGVGEPDQSVRMYCNRSCATRMNNVLHPKRGRYVVLDYTIPEKSQDGTYKTCMVCATNRSTSHNSLFCSEICRVTFWETYQVAKEVLDTEARERAKAKVRASRESSKKKCPHCDTMIQSGSRSCNTHRWTNGTYSSTRNTVSMWLSGEWTGQYGPKTPHVVSNIIRAYLYEQCDYSCTKCGFSESHPDDGSPILQINHIDGDATNHSQDNLEVLCPNCHAMTPNYGRRNKKSTRPR